MHNNTPLLHTLLHDSLHSTTRTALTRRLSSTLSTHLQSLHALTLSWPDDPPPPPSLTPLLHSLHHQPNPQKPFSFTPLSPHSTLALLSLSNTHPAFLAISATNELPTLLDPPSWTLFTLLLKAAQHNILRIEKIAHVSRRAHRHNLALRRQLHTEDLTHIVASSEPMKLILQQVERIAPYNTTVLITGESGTGKELIARTIHERSARARQPFLAVNCGALPDGLLESELFGHEKGSFTGASSLHRGRFERAKGGTLFLDEVGELPPPAQVKLLRVLQEGVFERVGGSHILRADVRIIAATWKPLHDMVTQNLFRQDLFYRINVFPIHIPPLRERPNDIPPLVHNLLETICNRLDRPIPNIPPHTLQTLQNAPWPGNVRELENTLERALILSPDDLLLLPPNPQHPNTPQPSQPTPPHTLPTFAQATRTCIERALSHTQGTLYGPHGAAQLLQLKPSTLQSKMKKLGIDRTHFLPKTPPQT